MRAFWGAPDGDERAAARRRSWSSTSSTRCAPTTPGVYGYPRKTTPELDAFAKDAVVFDARGRARVVDEAVGRVRPHVAAARRATAPCSCATRSTPRTRRSRSGSPSAAGRRAPRSRTPSSTARSRRSTRASTCSRACTARTTAAASSSGRTSSSTRRSRSCRSRRGPADVPVRAHDGPARAVRAARAVRPDVRAAPDRGPPGAGPAHRLQGAARPRADDRAVRRRRRLRRPRVRPLRARS